MATTVITGRDVTFTIGGQTYDAQTTSCELVNTHTIETYQTLDGRAYKAIDDVWVFNVQLLADWGASSGAVHSLCEDMWDAANSSPNTTLAVAFTAATGAAFAFNVLPIFPSAGGNGQNAQTQSWSMQVVGTPTLTKS